MRQKRSHKRENEEDRRKLTNVGGAYRVAVAAVGAISGESVIFDLSLRTLLKNERSDYYPNRED